MVVSGKFSCDGSVEYDSPSSAIDGSKVWADAPSKPNKQQKNVKTVTLERTKVSPGNV